MPKTNDRLQIWLPSLLAFACGSSSALCDDTSVDFQSRIRPLLSRSCFACHGPDQAARQADLRLDIAPSEQTSVPDLIIPGNARDSLLYQRLVAAHPEDRMPPPEANQQLTEEEIALVERWIDEGARWEDHWSFTAPRPTTPPATDSPEWCTDPLDHFILDRLEHAGLSPAPPADRSQLLRRVTFDLTGLPPEQEDIELFLADESPDAYERVVDRLLASEAYGERMAVTWLDLARYADTHGYQSDVTRPVWPWRDWVIRAFNENLPHDDFITWQLAGDLLPEPTRDQRLATAFNRLHRQTNEGGSVEEEFRVEYVADRVQTFGTAMLGLTTECARCHDHKYDPISHEEFYELFAFFDDIDESGLYSHFTNSTPTPALPLTSEEQDRALEGLHDRVARLESELQRRTPEQTAGFESWLENLDTLPVIGEQGDYDFDTPTDRILANRRNPDRPGALSDARVVVDSPDGSAIRLDGDDNANFPGVGEFDRDDPFTIVIDLRVNGPTDRAVIFHRSRAWTDAGSQGYQLLLEDGHATWSLIHFWPGNAIGVRSATPLPTEAWLELAVTYDGSSRADGLAMYVDGAPIEIEIVRDQLTRSITGGGPGPLTIGERFRDRGLKDGDVSGFRVFERRLTPVEIACLHDHTRLTVVRDETPERLLPTYLSIADPLQQERRTALHEARSERSRLLDGIPEIMTMTALQTPRISRVLERGRYDLPGRSVEPDTPERISPFPREAAPDRLGLARWTTAPENPLTARVQINRLWQIIFGRGLVATSEDFGSQGALPSHPELLDTLALDFIDSGWNTKAMIRRLVTSSTYRQSSRTDERTRTHDPENELLSRGPARRLTAEMLRDQALASSGLLARKVGGPSVFPEQPAGLWQEKNGSVYPTSSGEARHRRSLYTFWKRTSPPPAMMIFDATSRDVCVARRSSTSTPLQALVLLNDPQFLECARALAERVIDRAGEASDARIRLAFTLVTSRAPSERELAVLLQLHAEELETLTESEVVSLASTGEAGPREDMDSRQVAAMTIVCSTLLNSDAAVTRR